MRLSTTLDIITTGPITEKHERVDGIHVAINPMYPEIDAVFEKASRTQFGWPHLLGLFNSRTNTIILWDATHHPQDDMAYRAAAMWGGSYWDWAPFQMISDPRQHDQCDVIGKYGIDKRFNDVIHSLWWNRVRRTVPRTEPDDYNAYIAQLKTKKRRRLWPFRESDRIDEQEGSDIRAGGAFIIAASTKRILFAKRAGDGDASGVWACLGGKIEPGESVEEAIRREIEEEAGWSGDIDLDRIYTHRDPDLIYYNHIGIVQDEFEPNLNDEHSDYAWVRFGEWPKPLHPGIEEVLRDEHARNALRAATR